METEKNLLVNVIGGGLAGCEAAYQLLKRGYKVNLYEMRDKKMTPCHKTKHLAELVCSNSLKSTEKETASGILKAELEYMDSLLLRLAYLSRVEAGSALAINREKFSLMVEAELNKFSNFTLINEEVKKVFIEQPTIIAAGPLASEDLVGDIINLINNKDDLYFYDAVAPIISGDSIDMSKVFWASRYNKGDEKAYLNIPLNKEEYLNFTNALINAKTVPLKNFEKLKIFESCMPIEVMAKRGVDAMRFGPLRPVGIFGPNGEKYYAIVQLRKEDNDGKMFNIVGFQTNLTFPEQKRVFGMLNGLENVEFFRYGVLHRNTYLNSPKFLKANFQMKDYNNIFFAGQITGVEGYVESIMSGALAGINMARYLENKEPYIPSAKTISGALARHISTDKDVRFEPMNANLGFLEPLDKNIRDKKERKKEYFNVAINDIIKSNLLN